jgi:hypothetical protein
MFKKIALSIAAIAALAISTPRVAQAANGIGITNDTSKYVWFTIYEATMISPFTIANVGCLKPHEDYVFKGWANKEEVKVRAEVKQGDCRSGNINDVSVKRQSVDKYKGVVKTAVHENGGSFSINFIP